MAVIDFDGYKINTAFNPPAVVWPLDAEKQMTRAEIARVSAVVLESWKEAGCPTDRAEPPA